jgi:hypothetical protein
MWMKGYEIYCINCRGYFCIEGCDRLIALCEPEKVIHEVVVVVVVVCLMILSLYTPGASEELQSL